MLIRTATPADWDGIWAIFREICAAGETYAYAYDITESVARELWMSRPPGSTVVAVDDSGAVLGTAKMGPNREGGGAHISTASFMVDPAAAGRGVGRALGNHVVEWAKDKGYRGIQFNAVVESNTAAVRLWKALGFEILGTVPEGFRRPSGEYVGLHVMYRTL